MSLLTIQNGQFYMDGKKINLHSGAIHYFRTAQTDWKDRLIKLKKCGLNTVETYVAWNIHEPKEGVFNFEGNCDLEMFLQIATELGLHIILRPGPYICAEWEFGGYPSWLLSYTDLKFRCMNKRYLEKVDSYFDILMSKIKPYLSTNGGNIIAIQVENEYGSYGSDQEYLKYIRDGLIRRDIDVLLFTSDGANNSMLTCGTIEGVLPTINFGSNPKENFSFFEEKFPGLPKMCSEYWNGWFDQWGHDHIQREADLVYKDIQYMLENDISFNLYMFHGGTNFGFMNGAINIDGEGYRSIVTSYDYDALLTEWGEPTEKYWKIKALLNPEEDVEFHIKCMDYGVFYFDESSDLLDQIKEISTPIKSAEPMTFDELGISYGYVLYRHCLKGRRDRSPLILKGLKDRAQIFIDGEPKATYYRADSTDDFIELEVETEKQLDILVENMGRINYGAYINEHKGIVGGVWLGAAYGNFAHGFLNYTLPLDNLEHLEFIKGVTDTKRPTFLKATFVVLDPNDTFIQLKGLVKGIVIINGFVLGRYWTIGPQQTLYVPKSLLIQGENQVIIFEQHEVKQPSFELISHHNITKKQE